MPIFDEMEYERNLVAIIPSFDPSYFVLVVHWR